MRKIIIGNWKANKSVTEAQQWLADFSSLVATIDLSLVEPVLTPAFPLLFPVVANLPEQLTLGVQDISAYPAGSYTGGVSGQNLIGLPIKYAIVGHSERRRYFAETSEMVAKKVVQLLALGITPVVCVEEATLEEQVNKLGTDELNKCIIAYEPTAAIGSGQNAALSDVKAFKEKVFQLCGEVRFFYGGSVTEQTIAEYLFVVDGVIIGSASLEAKQFVAVLDSAQGKTPTGS